MDMIRWWGSCQSDLISTHVLLTGSVFHFSSPRKSKYNKGVGEEKEKEKKNWKGGRKKNHRDKHLKVKYIYRSRGLGIYVWRSIGYFPPWLEKANAQSEAQDCRNQVFCSQEKISADTVHISLPSLPEGGSRPAHVSEPPPSERIVARSSTIEGPGGARGDCTIGLPDVLSARYNLYHGPNHSALFAMPVFSGQANLSASSKTQRLCLGGNQGVWVFSFIHNCEMKGFWHIATVELIYNICHPYIPATLKTQVP